jgi:formylglycine-generating enzyme required for sulfatase activity
MTTCPNCNYERQKKDDIINPMECPRCGIIYSKWSEKIQFNEKTETAKETGEQKIIHAKQVGSFEINRKPVFFLSFIVVFLLASTFIISSFFSQRNSKTKEVTLEYTSPAIGATFVSIKPGSFSMGSPWTESYRVDNETQHQVKITAPFYIQTTPVTQGQWRLVMGNNPSYIKDCGDDCPVDNVSWNEAQEFISKLNKSENTRKYRLPTEAEWEYSARAGTRTPFYTGQSLSKNQANFLTSGQAPLPIRVANFAPNNWGLYDMHGNVSQWVLDWFGNYSKDDATDPTGPENGTHRVIRGCGYLTFLNHCRCAYRGAEPPTARNYNVGFRLVWDPNI